MVHHHNIFLVFFTLLVSQAEVNKKCSHRCYNSWGREIDKDEQVDEEGSGVVVDYLL